MILLWALFIATSLVFIAFAAGAMNAASEADDASDALEGDIRAAQLLRKDDA